MLCILSRDRRSLSVKSPLPETKTDILVEIIKLYVRRALEKSGLKQKYLLVLKWTLRMFCACPYISFLFLSSRLRFVSPAVVMVVAILYFYIGFLTSLLVSSVCTLLILAWLGIQLKRLQKKIKFRGRSLTGSSILDEILYDLGELSWLALQRDTYQLLIKKISNFNVFLPAATKSVVAAGTCLSFCSQGGGVCLSACWDTTPPLGADTPRGPDPPLGADTPGTRCTPRTRHTPPGSRHPPGPGTSPQDQVHPSWDQVHPPRTRYTPLGPGTPPPPPPGTRYTIPPSSPPTNFFFFGGGFFGDFFFLYKF